MSTQTKKIYLQGQQDTMVNIPLYIASSDMSECRSLVINDEHSSELKKL